MEYTRKLASDGTPTYYRDGKRIKRTLVPKDEYAKFETIDEAPVQTATVKSDIPEKVCLFCGQEGTHTRFIDFQTVYLCEEHYLSQTLGKIAHKVREN